IAAVGLFARNPPGIVVNLMSPAPSGSVALMLRSARTCHPAGAWARTGAMAIAATRAVDRKRFIGDLQKTVNAMCVDVLSYVLRATRGKRFPKHFLIPIPNPSNP